MGWRERLTEKLALFWGCDLVEARLRLRTVTECTSAMPAPDRIALARELLAGTGRVVARDVGDITGEEWGGVSRAGGWNACRAAMLKEDGDE